MIQGCDGKSSAGPHVPEDESRRTWSMDRQSRAFSIFACHAFKFIAVWHLTYRNLCRPAGGRPPSAASQYTLGEPPSPLPCDDVLRPIHNYKLAFD